MILTVAIEVLSLPFITTGGRGRRGRGGEGRGGKEGERWRVIYLHVSTDEVQPCRKHSFGKFACNIKLVTLCFD